MVARTPRPPARSRTLFAAAALVVAGALSALPGTATADPLADKQAEAERIRQRVEQLGHEVERYAEAAHAAQIELDSLSQQVAEAEARVAEAQAHVAEHRAEIKLYAVDAYVRHGLTADAMASVGDLNVVGQRHGYLSAAVGNSEKLIDRLKATEEDLGIQIGQLNATKAEVESTKSALDTQRANAQGAVDEQNRILSQVQGELAALVRQAEARAEAQRQADARSRASAATSSQRTIRAASAPSGPAPAVSGGAGTAVSTALAQVGDPYVWGAAGPDAFDCSGLTMYAWRAAGVSLPHNTSAQYGALRHISLDQLAPGDIVFYNGFGHAGMYIGGGSIVHAPRTGKNVEVVSLYYVGNPIAAGRP